MPQNLRDRGYSSSMDGYKPAPYHSRRKKTAAGTAQVQKGEEVNRQSVRDSGALRLPSPEEIRASYGTATINAGSPQRSAPLNLQYSDRGDKISHDDNVEIPYREYARERDSALQNTMSLDEIRRRMQELERVLSGAYASQNANRAAVSGSKKTTQPTSEAREMPKAYADYNWDVEDFLAEWAPDLGNDAYVAFRDIERAKAAATGRALAMKAMSMAQTNMNAQNAQHAQNLNMDEAAIDNLYFEYNNLKNEYNARLAQYLQGLR